MTDYELTQTVIGRAMKVHSALGPGLLESAYQECLCFELLSSGLYVEKEKPMPLIYSEVKLDCGYRVDIMVEPDAIRRVVNRYDDSASSAETSPPSAVKPSQR